MIDRLRALGYRYQYGGEIERDLRDVVMAAWLRAFLAKRCAHLPAEAIEELERLVPDFSRAYEPDGLTVEEFDSFGATVRTLRSFIASYQELVATVRDVILPSPD